MNAKILPAGESCLFVEFGDIVSRELNARVTALKAALLTVSLIRGIVLCSGQWLRRCHRNFLQRIRSSAVLRLF